METAIPNMAPAAGSMAVSSACWVQVVPERTKMYAAPTPPSLRYAPTSAVSPLNEMARPKLSGEAPSEAVNSACWVQVVPERTNT